MILAMDSTTLTRTIKIMRQQRWVAELPAAHDRRERLLSLSERRSRAALHWAEPEWKKMQERLRHRLGQENWENLMHAGDRVATLALGEAELQPAAGSDQFPTTG